jgi:hypothetical protein
MRDPMAAICAADVTRTLTQNLSVVVPDGPLTLYRALHEVSLEAAEQRGYVAATTSVTVFCPVEAVAAACGVHRVTVWRWAAVLKGLGLIDARPLKGTLRGATRNSGTLWAVRLRPGGGRAAKVTHDDLKHRWRDLDADVRRGRTVYRQLRADDATIKGPLEGSVDLELIRAWALSPTRSTPVISDSCTRARVSLEAVLDVPHAQRGERNRVVELAAEALAQALADRRGVNFYRRLVWQLLRRADAGGGEHWHAVYEQARRAAVDAAEGFARRPGALFVSRLKGAPWWDEVMRGPPVRVGGPLKASSVEG